MPEKQKKDRVAIFLTTQATRADLAELRRAAMEGESSVRDLRILHPYLDDYLKHSRTYQAQRLIAGLFAFYAMRFWHFNSAIKQWETKLPVVTDQFSLGTSLGQLRNQLYGVGSDEEQSTPQTGLDLRFAALLRTSRENLAVPLRGLLQRLAEAEVPVHFGALIKAIAFWDDSFSGIEAVQQKWARHYWQAVNQGLHPTTAK